MTHLKIWITVSVLALGACSSKPSGQVVAVVNGDEISLQELNAEVEGLNVPPNADKKLVRREMLQRVIDRRLLAQEAKRDGLDRDPAYIVQQRKLSEDLLVQMYGKRAADSIRVPDAAAVQRYISANPAMFTQRTRYKVDQIQFPMPANPEQLRKLDKDHSLEAVATSLTAMGIKFERGASMIDSGVVPPDMMRQIMSLPPGEPFIVPAGNNILVSVITGSEPLVVPPDQTRPLAVQSLRRESLNKIGETRLKEARSKAKIEYQPDFTPVPKAAPQAVPKSAPKVG